MEFKEPMVTKRSVSSEVEKKKEKEAGRIFFKTTGVGLSFAGCREA